MASPPDEAGICVGDPQQPAQAWRNPLKHGLFAQGLCVFIAFVFWLLDASSSFVTAWLYAVCIGTSCWLFIEGIRLSINRVMTWAGASPALLAAGRGTSSLIVSVIVGSALGYSVGTPIADALTGFRSPSLLDNRAVVVLTLIATSLAVYFSATTERLARERQAAESARRAATETRLKLLESQLEPHMLFNTLANLRVLIALDAPRAQAMLDRLIAFLRATLNASLTNAHALSAEFDRTADYLELMAIRMGPRLAFALDLPADLRVHPVPPLLLQPLVENCIKHGLEPKVSGGRIEVAARRNAAGTTLVITVRDTGIGLVDSTTSRREGFGTHQVRERLAAVYHGAASLDLRNAEGPEGGTLATLHIPLEA